MGKKAKYYVVWNGVTPGIYSSWNECLQQTKGYKGALYKSFPTLSQAEDAYVSGPENTDQTHKAARDLPCVEKKTVEHPSLPSGVPTMAIAVDAACSGNPGAMEYRGVFLQTGQEIFHYGPTYGTNNIGEFLAIVHALALLEKMQIKMPIYSDSHNALLWIRKKKCNTKLARNTKTEHLFQMIERAETWLRKYSGDIPLRKWDTMAWGEIPADFGRK